jgi:Flp pilus assembly pilin Flp
LDKIGTDIDGEAGGDYSGFSVSLSRDGVTLAIGAYRNDGNGSNAGSVRVYQNVSGTWTKIGADIDGEKASDYSGISVSLSSDGSVLAIGAYLNAGNGAGTVRVYQNVSGTWTKIGTNIDGEAYDDLSGISVSLSSDGSILAIGADSNDGNGTDSGSVRVYQNVSGTWTKIGGDIDGEAADDYSGGCVSLSSDGSTLAIGAAKNGGSGINAGSVRVYKNVSGIWTKTGADIDGEAAEDFSGISVSLSSDGSILAIGARLNDGNALNSGSVRVYNLLAVLSSDSFVLDNFTVYPNPTSEAVTISLQEDLTLEKVNIYNTLGQLIKTEKNNTISVSSLAKGSYFFEVFTNKGKATKTILVQ